MRAWILIFALALPVSAQTAFQLTTTSSGVAPTPYPNPLRGCCGNALNTVESARGTFSWTAFDAWRTAASSHSVLYMYTMQEIPYWMSGTSSGGSSPPSDIAVSATCQAPISTVTTTDCQWKELTTAIVQHVTGLSSTPGSPVSCPQLDFVEVGNEWDTDSSTGAAGTGFNGTAAQAATLYNDAATIIHAYCSNTKVSPSSVSTIVGFHANGDNAHYDVYMNMMLTAIHAIGGYSAPDFVSMHIYSARGNVSPVPFPTSITSNSYSGCTGTSNSNCYVAIKNQVSTLVTAIAASNSWASSLPIYSTEGGFGILSQLCGTTCSNTAADTVFLRSAWVAQYLAVVWAQGSWTAGQFAQYDMLYAAFDGTWGCYESCGSGNSGWYNAFIQAQSWLGSASAHGSLTSSSITGGTKWTLPVTISGVSAELDWCDAYYPATCTTTTSFSTQQNLAGATSPTGGALTLTQQPVLLTNSSVTAQPTGGSVIVFQ